mmetsp:Transcript_75627/g.225430  ORF Transcript_75627/g.225430 Transcript_75627/m.225430 type:complete len:531 (-) Transcript_75627:47-1639(-)
MIMTSNIEQYQPGLRLLVIAERYRIPDDFFRALCSDKQVDQSRQEMRQAIDQAFESKRVASLPDLSKEPQHASAISDLRSDILSGCRPVASGGAELTGAEIAEVLSEICGEVMRWSRDASFKAAIEPDSSYARVVKARLKMTAERLAAEYRASVPGHGPPWHPDVLQELESAVAPLLRRFDQDTSGITSNATPDIREALEKELTAICRTMRHQNDEHRASRERAIGDITDTLRCTFRLILPRRPLARALTKDELKALEAQRVSHLGMFQTQVEERGLSCEAAILARGQLGDELEHRLAEIVEASSALHEEECRHTANCRHQRRTQHVLVAAAAIGLATAVPAEWRTAAGGALRTFAIRQLGGALPGAHPPPAAPLQPPQREPQASPSPDREPVKERIDRVPEAPSADQAAALDLTRPREAATTAPDSGRAASAAADVPAAEPSGSSVPSAPLVPDAAATTTTDAPQVHVAPPAPRPGGRRQGWRRRWQPLLPPRRPSLGAVTLNPELTPWALLLVCVGAVGNVAYVSMAG